MLRVVRAVLSLSMIQPPSQLPITPLRPAEHYHTYGELEHAVHTLIGSHTLNSSKTGGPVGLFANPMQSVRRLRKTSLEVDV